MNRCDVLRYTATAAAVPGDHGVGVVCVYGRQQQLQYVAMLIASRPKVLSLNGWVTTTWVVMKNKAIAIRSQQTKCLCQEPLIDCPDMTVIA